MISFVISFWIFFFGEGKLNLSNKNIKKIITKTNKTSLIILWIMDSPSDFCLLNLSCIVNKYI